MEEYANKFLELLRYVRYIKDDKVKIQRFLSGLPQSYKDRIEFDEPRTLEEAIRKARYFHEQSRGKPYYHTTWKDIKNENSDQRKKGFKPSNFRNQQKHPSQATSKPTGVVGEKPRDPQQNREPLQCWKCGGPHMRRNCPLENESVRLAYNLQEEKIVGHCSEVCP